MKKIVSGFLLMTGQAFAHPHMWADVSVVPQVNDNGEITALRQSWAFDPYFSAVMLEDIGKNGMDALKQDMQETLAKSGFYTHPRDIFAEGEGMVLQVERGILVLQVTIPLQTPAKSVEYRIYEPEYYMEMLHSEAQAAEIGNCRLTLRESAPSADMVAAAAALDITDNAPPDLGGFFAEYAEWQCR